MDTNIAFFKPLPWFVLLPTSPFLRRMNKLFCQTLCPSSGGGVGETERETFNDVFDYFERVVECNLFKPHPVQINQLFALFLIFYQ